MLTSWSASGWSFRRRATESRQSSSPSARAASAIFASVSRNSSSPNAIAEVRRYTLTPTQPSSYALGREAILGLREKARAKGWGMRFFHDKLLGAGSLPPKLLARDVDLA